MLISRFTHLRSRIRSVTTLCCEGPNFAKGPRLKEIRDLFFTVGASMPPDAAGRRRSPTLVGGAAVRSLLPQCEP